MRLNLYRALICEQPVGFNTTKVLCGVHRMASSRIHLPFALANCILQRLCHRCPRPHQWWAWWPGCRCFLVLCGWTVGRKKYTIKNPPGNSVCPWDFRGMRSWALEASQKERSCAPAAYTLSLSPHMECQIYWQLRTKHRLQKRFLKNTHKVGSEILTHIPLLSSSVDSPSEYKPRGAGTITLQKHSRLCTRQHPFQNLSLVWMGLVGKSWPYNKIKEVLDI